MYYIHHFVMFTLLFMTGGSVHCQPPVSEITAFSFHLTRINRKSLFYIFPLCVTLKKKGVFHYVTYG